MVTVVPTFPLVGEKELIVGTCPYILINNNTNKGVKENLNNFDIYE
jgi:hypothetical protein